jgi:hypothetical protein
MGPFGLESSIDDNSPELHFYYIFTIYLRLPRLCVGLFVIVMDEAPSGKFIRRAHVSKKTP